MPIVYSTQLLSGSFGTSQSLTVTAVTTGRSALLTFDLDSARPLTSVTLGGVAGTLVTSVVNSISGNTDYQYRWDNITGSPTNVSFAYSGGNALPDPIVFQECSPLGTATVGTAASGSTGSSITASVTTSVVDEMVQALMIIDSAQAISAPAGYSAQPTIGTSVNVHLAWDPDVGAAGVQSPSFGTASTNWFARLVAYADAGPPAEVVGIPIGVMHPVGLGPAMQAVAFRGMPLADTPVTGVTMTADLGSYTLTGETANLLYSRIVQADPGAYALTGNAANTLFNRLVSADAGTYALTGNDASLLLGKRLVADAGSLTLTGGDASLVYARILIADPGSFTLTGNDATLTYTVGYTVTADPGSYSLTGNAAGLIYSRRLTADPGSYALTGGAANLAVGRLLTADPGSYALTGNAANLLQGKRVQGDAGSYTLTGGAANLLYARRLVSDAGSYVLNGNDATLTLLQAGTLLAAPGAYVLTGGDATLTYSANQATAAGGYGSNRRRIKYRNLWLTEDELEQVLQLEIEEEAERIESKPKRKKAKPAKRSKPTPVVSPVLPDLYVQKRAAVAVQKRTLQPDARGVLIALLARIQEEIDDEETALALLL